MSVTRRTALVLILAVATLTLCAASVFAQGSSPNPSGGTRCRPIIEEGTGSVSLGGYLSRGFSIDLGLRAWLTNYAVSRFYAPAATHPVSGRTLTAAVQRRVWAR